MGSCHALRGRCFHVREPRRTTAKIGELVHPAHPLSEQSGGHFAPADAPRESSPATGRTASPWTSSVQGWSCTAECRVSGGGRGE